MASRGSLTSATWARRHNRQCKAKQRMARRVNRLPAATRLGHFFFRPAAQRASRSGCVANTRNAARRSMLCGRSAHSTMRASRTSFSRRLCSTPTGSAPCSSTRARVQPSCFRAARRRSVPPANCGSTIRLRQSPRSKAYPTSIHSLRGSFGASRACRCSISELEAARLIRE